MQTAVTALRSGAFERPWGGPEAGLMTTPGVLAQRAAIYTLASLGNSAIPFLLLPLLTRVLTPTDYGIVIIFSTVITVAGAFTGLSIHGAVNVRYHDQSIDISRYIGTALSVLAASTVGVLLLALLAGERLAAWSGIPHAWLFVAILVSAAQFVVQLRLVTWQAQGMAVQFGALQVMQTALNLSLSVLLVVPTDWSWSLGWEGRAAAIATATLMAGAGSLWLLQRRPELSWRPRLDYVRDTLRFGVPLVPHVIGSVAVANSDRIVVAGLAGLHEAGVYAASMQLGMLVAVLADAVVKALSPWIFSSLGSSNSVVRVRIVRVSYLFFAGMLLVAAVTALAGSWLLQLVGSAFRGSSDVLALIALGSAFGGMYLMVVSYIFYARRNEWLSFISLSVGALNFALTWWLVAQYGAVGAAQAFAVSQFLMFACTWYAASRLCPMPWRTGLLGFLQTRHSGA